MRSPEAYEALREKVKGPKDLEHEMRRSEQMAELRFAIESEPDVAAALQSQIAEDIREHGVEAVVDAPGRSAEQTIALEQGNFSVRVDAHPQTHEDVLVALPEGNVREKIPVQPVYSDKYVGQFVRQADA